MMLVSVWGEVRAPGLVRVPDRIDLVSLLSAAGGPTNDGRLDNVRLIRHVGNAGHDSTTIVDVSALLDENRLSDVPLIAPGDAVIVSRKASTIFASVVSVLYSLAIIASVVTSIILALKK